MRYLNKIYLAALDFSLVNSWVGCSKSEVMGLGYTGDTSSRVSYTGVTSARVGDTGVTSERVGYTGATSARVGYTGATSAMVGYTSSCYLTQHRPTLPEPLAAGLAFISLV